MQLAYSRDVLHLSADQAIQRIWSLWGAGKFDFMAWQNKLLRELYAMKPEELLARVKSDSERLRLESEAAQGHEKDKTPQG